MAKTYADTLDDQARLASAFIERDAPEWAAIALAADSYFVTTEFIKLAIEAAAHLPHPTELIGEDFPSRSGWVSLAEPIVEIYKDDEVVMAGFFWNTLSDGVLSFGVTTDFKGI